MRVLMLLSVMLPWFVVVAGAQEKLPPPNKSPQLWRASASLRDEKVVIQIARPEYEAPRKAVAAEVMKWDNLRTVTLGETVKAFGVDGKPLGPESVLKAIAKPKGVAVFVRFYRTKSGGLIDPDPFYLAMLREGTIVLVVAAEDIGPLPPLP